ncbi:MAG: CapA family protein [Patescibacteria group bacterium]
MPVKKILLLTFILFLSSGCSSAGVFNNDIKLVPKETVGGSPKEFSLPEAKSVKILHFGDIMLDRNVKKRIDENGEDYLLSGLAGENNQFFSGYDIITANLEGPFADRRRQTSKEIAFRFDPALIPMLQKYNFNLFTLANNHSLDMSREGFAESKENLKNAGIDFYGIGYGVSDESMIIKEVNGISVAFIGVDDTLTPINMVKMKELLAKAGKEADYTIVDAHWGNEYAKLKSNQRQQSLARQFIDNGADIIIGHHPHVIQEIEIYQDRPIFYSLGNFIFDQYFSAETQEGLGVALEIAEDGKLKIELFLLKGEMSRVSVMKGEEAETLMEEIIFASRLGDYKFSNLFLELNAADTK